MPGDEISPEELEILAKATHERYLAALVEPDPEVPTHRSWEDLREADRAQNRDQVRHQLDDLRELGLVVERANPSSPSAVTFDPDLVEAMARREHNRWMRRKSAQGYAYGPKRIDDPPDCRQHPDMVDYDDLTEETKDKDRAPIRQFPEVLLEAGFVISRG